MKKINENILNFYDLYSDNNQIVYNAILKKKDWMFRKLFVPCSFHSLVVDSILIYPDLFGLMDQALVFDKLLLDESLFKGYEKKIKLIEKTFNEKYRIKYAYEKIIPLKDESTFWVEMDFTKLDKKTYNELVSNFYPCISNLEEMDLFYDEKQDIDLLKYPMYGNNGKWVFILDKHLLINERYYFQNCLKKIWYNSKKLDLEQIESLKEIAKANLIEVGDYNGK